MSNETDLRSRFPGARAWRRTPTKAETLTWIRDRELIRDAHTESRCPLGLVFLNGLVREKRRAATRTMTNKSLELGAPQQRLPHIAEVVEKRPRT